MNSDATDCLADATPHVEEPRTDAPTKSADDHTGDDHHKDDPTQPPSNHVGSYHSEVGFLPDGTANPAAYMVALYIDPTDKSLPRLEANFTNYGARCVSWLARDKDGNSKDVIVSYDVIGEKSSEASGFWMESYWKTTPGDSEDGPSVTFTQNSPANDQDFPSALQADVTFTLLPTNEIRILYSVKNTGKKITDVSVTDHTYFNFEQNAKVADGEALAPINDYKFTILSARRVFDAGIACAGVVGRKFVFSLDKASDGSYYDLQFCLDGGSTLDPREVATVHDPTGGLQLTVEKKNADYLQNY